MTSQSRKATLPALPEPLLAPLTDSAGEVLRSLESQEIPVALRHLAGFDRRGLARSAARHQLLRAIETDDAFRERTLERFCSRAEVAAALERWDSAQAFGAVEEAAERADLPLIASMLYAARPPGWAFGLGVVCAVFERQRREKEENAAIRARDLQIAALEESQRRADAARRAAESDARRFEQDLRDERQGRRARDAQAARDAAEAQQRAEEAERALAKVRSAGEAAEERIRREAGRARAAEKALRELRMATDDAEERRQGAGVVLRPDDLRALAEAAELARRLADGLGGVADRARALLEPAPARPSLPERLGQRVQVPIPPGMVEDDPVALDAMLRAGGVVLVVDGYNVSMLAWGDLSPSEQRERLLAAIGELHLRTRAKAIVVFDGADVERVRSPRRAGVKVVFSPADEEADAVVVEQVAALPEDVPVIVASSDGWVRNQALSARARVVSSQTLLSVLRR